MSQAEGGRKTDVDRVMAEGLQAFREGRASDAARAFRQAADLAPNNEFAWIWVAQTTTDPTDQRIALERALAANPDSKYANDALRRINNNFGAQRTAEIPTIPSNNPPVGSIENIQARPSGRVSFPVDTPPPAPPPAPPPPDLRNAPPPSFDDIRATLVPAQTAPQSAPKGRKQTNRRGANVRPAAQTGRRANDKKMRRGRGNGLLIFVLALLLIATLAAIIIALYNFLPVSNVADVPTTTPVATTEPLSTSTAAASTATENAIALPTNTTLPTQTAAPTSTPAPTPTLAPVLAANTAAAAQASRNGQVAQLYTTAQSLSGQGKDADAATQLEQAVALDRNNPTLQYQLGLTYLRLARSTPATPNTAATTPTNVTTVSGTSAVTTPTTPSATTQPAATGVSNPAALDKAVGALQRVTALRPNWPGGFTQLAQALILRGDVPAAIAALQDSLKLDPNGADRWLLLADLYDRTNQPKEAAYARSRAGVVTASPATPATLTSTP